MVRLCTPESKFVLAFRAFRGLVSFVDIKNLRLINLLQLIEIFGSGLCVPILFS